MIDRSISSLKILVLLYVIFILKRLSFPSLLPLYSLYLSYAQAHTTHTHNTLSLFITTSTSLPWWNDLSFSTLDYFSCFPPHSRFPSLHFPHAFSLSLTTPSPSLLHSFSLLPPYFLTQRSEVVRTHFQQKHHPPSGNNHTSG